MSFFFNNAHFLSIIIIVCLFFAGLIQVRKYFKNKNTVKAFRFLIFYRITAILIIIGLFIQPIFYIDKDSKETLELATYIDNSKSMNNNISLNEMHAMISHIEKWSSDNNYNISLNLIGDNTRLVDDIDDIDFSDSITDFDDFRESIISKESSHFLLIADGNSPVGLHQQYNFNKKINVLGIGERQKIKVSFENAYLSKEKDDIFANIAINSKNIESNLELDFFQNDSLLESYSMNLFNDSTQFKKININYLELDDYNDLKFILRNRQSEIDRINVLTNQLNLSKRIVLLSGNLSLNSQYISSRLKDAFDVEIDFFYRVNSNWNNSINYEYDKLGMIVLDDYPTTSQDLNDFEMIVNNSKKNGVPIMMICGESQDYNLLKQISDIFLFKIEQQPVERKLEESNKFGRYNTSDFYVIEDSSSFSIKCSDDSRNLNYKDKSSAVCYLDNSAIMFYPNISKIAYKTLEFNERVDFDTFINNILKDIYYADKNVELHIKKEHFYNNEKIKVQLLNNSGANLEKMKLYRYNENSREEVPIDDFFTISKPGQYTIRLMDDNDDSIGNTINLKIRDFLDESKLEGQGYRFLFDISNQSGGIYSDYSFDDIAEYLNQIKIKKNKTNDELYDKIDFKDYLFLLILSVIMLSLEWLFRKRAGLL